ncbi:hypothetical protein MPDQ_007074 [Monascus purpureus]|uniref:Uncharacterized protein n=1 Tax=Monascus purpureus TaxID=5098 RepID=A0A507R235_MONPU|nr:hypothetical protein MPDQ_007074 [Monascus purpureus]
MNTLKRRRRRPASEDSSLQNQTFYFVDRNSSSSEKRSHVMRHHIQEKRRQRKLSNRSGDWRQENQIVQYLPLQHAPTSVEGDRAEISRENNSGATSNSDSSTSYLLSKPTSYCISSLQPTPMITSLDFSRIDPADSLPMTLSHEDLDLVDHWKNRLTYWSGQNRHVKDRIFRTAMQHRVSFQTVILTFCARWKMQLYDLKDSKEAEYHLNQSTKAVQEVEQSTQADEDAVAMALGGLAIQEERFGSKSRAEEYMSRALRIIRPRTGSNRPVEVFLLYVRFIMSPLDPVIDEEGQRWLVTFLRGAEELMMEHRTESYLSAVRQRREAFRMESPLFPLLSSGPRPSRVPQDARKYVVENPPTQEACRSASLIYITAALWDFKDSPTRTRRFLEHLSSLAKEHSLDRDLACETFLWLLLEEGYDADLRDSERGWSTGALLQKHKQLRPDLQFHFNELLMSFLMLDAPIRGIAVFEQELDMITARTFV